jgi:hypothetical protein
MPHPLASVVHISPAVWPGRAVPVQPGDFSKFAPGGLGMDGAVFPIRPWDNPLGPSPSRFYGYEQRSGDPYHNAPLSCPAGGTLYFDSGLKREEFDTMLRLLGVEVTNTFYAVFLVESGKTQEERYLAQIRLVGADALQRMFNVEGLPETLPWVQQTMSLADLLWRFIELETEKYGTGMCRDLYGKFGGDGDWAKESLCFGFMVENNEMGVYRLWSRAWLVTK